MFSCLVYTALFQFKDLHLHKIIIIHVRVHGHHAQVHEVRVEVDRGVGLRNGVFIDIIWFSNDI